MLPRLALLTIATHTARQAASRMVVQSRTHSTWDAVSAATKEYSHCATRAVERATLICRAPIMLSHRVTRISSRAASATQCRAWSRMPWRLWWMTLSISVAVSALTVGPSLSVWRSMAVHTPTSSALPACFIMDAPPLKRAQSAATQAVCCSTQEYIPTFPLRVYRATSDQQVRINGP